MGRITNYQMSYLLSVSTHRAKYPVVNWVEEQMKREDNYNWSRWLGYGALECVHILLGENKFSYTLNQDLRVTSLFDCHGFRDVSEPTKEDIDFLEVIYPEEYKSKFAICHSMEEIFKRPHSCLIQPEFAQKNCRCGKVGTVNYYSGYSWEYYCGRGMSCTP